MRAALPLTEKPEAAPESVQAPPISLVPSPFATMRLNVSNANAGGGLVTVRSCVTVPVSPMLSVTVSVTEYVPGWV